MTQVLERKGFVFFVFVLCVCVCVCVCVFVAQALVGKGQLSLAQALRIGLCGSGFSKDSCVWLRYKGRIVLCGSGCSEERVL